MNVGDGDDLRGALEATLGAGGGDPPEPSAPAVTEPPAGDGAPPPASNEPPPAAAPPPFDIPQNFPHAYRPSLEALSKEQAARQHAEAWLKHFRESESFIGRLKENYAGLKQAYDPLNQVLQPYVEGWQRNGVQPAQAVQQLMAWGNFIASNPQQGLRELAKYYNVNLDQLVQEEPYVDPAVAGRVSALDQKLSQVTQFLQGTMMQQQQQRQNAVVQHIRAFESETDANGQPKHPHFQRVAENVIRAVQSGFAQDLESAYQFAVRNDPELMKEIEAEKARAAAAKSAADAQRAAAASRQVTGKGGADKPAQKSLRDDLAESLGMTRP